MIVLFSAILFTIGPFSPAPQLPLNEGSLPSISLDKGYLLQNPPSSKESTFPWVSTLCAGVALLALKNRSKIKALIISQLAVKPLSPAQSLDKLMALHLPKKGHYKEFYSQLVQIIRNKFVMVDKTTEELLNTTQGKDLRVILEKADRVKFGRESSTETECENMAHLLRDFLSKEAQNTSMPGREG